MGFVENDLQGGLMSRFVWSKPQILGGGTIASGGSPGLGFFAPPGSGKAHPLAAVLDLFVFFLQYRYILRSTAAANATLLV